MDIPQAGELREEQGLGGHRWDARTTSSIAKAEGWGASRWRATAL
jgi:hypothetical protein